jgi:transcriptional regulator with XRE-family HTH domain
MRELKDRLQYHLTARRAELGRTQQEVADDAAISVQQYCHIENGRRMPSLLVLERIAIALHCQSAELLGANPSGIMKRVVCPCCQGDGIIPQAKASAFRRVEPMALAGLARMDRGD